MDKQTVCLHAIKTAYPGLGIDSARLHTGEGQFNDILFINDELIFRFPRYEDSIRDFLREVDLLQRLQGRMSLPIPDPIYASSGTKGVGNVFMGYKMLPGKPLFREVLNGIQNDAVLERMAQQLANFLLGLHSLSPALLGLDLPTHDQVLESKKLFCSIQEHLFPRMRPDARKTVTVHFEEYFANASLHQYPPSLIHGDFGGSNILFEDDQITGIIDFSFTALDDPAMDLAAVSTLGTSFFDRFCSYYSPDGSMLARARFYRGTYALQEALHGFQNNDPEAFRSGMEQYI